MAASFVREERYLVIKIKDAREYLDAQDQHLLDEIAQRVEFGRIGAGKSCLQCVVVEHDWPEYEPTWTAIEARMTANEHPRCDGAAPAEGGLNNTGSSASDNLPDSIAEGAAVQQPAPVAAVPAEAPAAEDVTRRAMRVLDEN
ncbi:hypothetical protein [Pseudothauera rhizosphaerae]|uniref:Uncharacterized protein n=1 Tax=Pseudothauera rhizosphaerae TaxID=2565932 RepID=A0A4S4AWD5_9RHOO|nr:hypothetical protein [Pseudothauera rhizosphaerae]THF64354.1 hypothetical protein E6O51_03325 [Pseudothauera rhizosphaerae]